MLISNPGHITMMAAMPIYGKKNLLLWNWLLAFQETSHVVSGTIV